jgi:hypothetical protein
LNAFSALSRFLNGGVGEADDGELARESAAHIDLHLNEIRVDPVNRRGKCLRKRHEDCSFARSSLGRLYAGGRVAVKRQVEGFTATFRHWPAYRAYGVPVEVSSQWPSLDL